MTREVGFLDSFGESVKKGRVVGLGHMVDVS